MRRLAMMLTALGLIPTLALATTPPAEELVNAAVQAVHQTCYEARMRFLSPLEDNREQVVHIFHVAPDLYSVTPLVNGEPGNVTYIENAVELVRVRKSHGEVHSVEQLPMQQFSINDSLTIKFLRDLVRYDVPNDETGNAGGTVVLDGLVGDTEAWILRQHMHKDKPYTITVGLDKSSNYPLLLLVIDGEGVRRVFYEMEVIEYRDPFAIQDEYFVVPELPAKRKPAARPSPLFPEAQLQFEDNQNIALQRSASSVWETYPLPLYPQILPDGFYLDSINMLDYMPQVDGLGEPAFVYQLDVYGPSQELLSIFQTPLDFEEPSMPDVVEISQAGLVVRQQDNWLVVVLGDLPLSQLMTIAEGLQPDGVDVERMLLKTWQRDMIYEEAARDSSR